MDEAAIMAMAMDSNNADDLVTSSGVGSAAPAEPEQIAETAPAPRKEAPVVDVAAALARAEAEAGEKEDSLFPKVGADGSMLKAKNGAASGADAAADDMKELEVCR